MQYQLPPHGVLINLLYTVHVFGCALQESVHSGLCDDPLPVYYVKMSWQAGKRSGLRTDYVAVRT